MHNISRLGFKGVPSGYYFTHEKWKHNGNYVKLTLVQALLRIIRLVHRKSYLVIIGQIHIKGWPKVILDQTLLRYTLLAYMRSYLVIIWPQSTWSWAKMTIGQVREFHLLFVWFLFASIHMKSSPKVVIIKWKSVQTLLKCTRLALWGHIWSLLICIGSSMSMELYFVIEAPNWHTQITKYEIRSSLLTPICFIYPYLAPMHNYTKYTVYTNIKLVNKNP